jgi:hypothetical protein
VFCVLSRAGRIQFINILQDKFDDTKGEIRSRKSMKDSQYNGQKISKGKSEAVNQ